jgi:cytochrome oxidase Cu insertion factor (SCO1/SenC/PrrC family)
MNKRAQLYALLALFFGPLLIAWIWFFQFEDVRPGTVNKGDLIEPVVALADLELVARGEEIAASPFAGDWSIVVLAPETCDERCEQALYITRQVWIRLNKDADRVQRVLLAGPDVDYPAAAHLDLKAYDADASTFARFIDSIERSSDGAERVYLVDPQGNLMMSYPPEFTPAMLHDDLKRLLRYSDAG